MPRELVAAGYVSAAASALGMIGAAVYVVWTEPMLRLAAWCTSPLPEKIRRAILHQLELGAAGMGALRQPVLLVGIVTTSLLQWFLMSACIYFSLQAMDAVVPPSASFIVLAATVLGVMVPAAPGFFGTLELSFVLALKPFMVEESRAMAAAVFYHIIPYLGVTLVGLYFLRQAGLRLRDRARRQPDPGTIGRRHAAGCPGHRRGVSREDAPGLGPKDAIAMVCRRRLSRDDEILVYGRLPVGGDRWICCSV